MGIYSFSSAIAEIKYYQRYEMHVEALDIATEVDKEALDVKERITLYKLMALSYRKIDCSDYALIYINKAISLLQEEKSFYSPDDFKTDYGILLMNKGVVFHSQSKNDSAIDCYSRAISLFENLTIPNNNLLVNSYISIGEVYLDLEHYFRSLCYFRYAEEKMDNSQDIRWGYVHNKISELEKLIQNDGEGRKND